jgi:hypothetical protein
VEQGNRKMYIKGTKLKGTSHQKDVHESLAVVGFDTFVLKCIELVECCITDKKIN